MPITHAKVSAKSDGGDSSLVLPSDWNDDHVIDGADFGFHGAVIRRTTGFTPASASNTTIDFDTEVIDTDGFANLGAQPKRLTVPTAFDGKYGRVGVMAIWDGDTTGNYRELKIFRNGDTAAPVAIDQIHEVQGDFNTGHQTISPPLLLADADYFEFAPRVDVTGAELLSADDYSIVFWIEILGGYGPTGPTGPTGDAMTEILDSGTAETNTALVLAPDGIGGVEFRAEAGGGGLDSGTSFPGSPATDDLFYRTDHDTVYFYNGTNWLSVDLRSRHFTNRPLPFTATDTFAYCPAWDSTYDVWLETLHIFHNTGATNNGSNYWTFDVVRGTDSGGTGSSLGSVTTSADATSKYLDKTLTIGALMGTTSSNTWLIISGTKTSAASNIDWYSASLLYRRVG